MRLGRISIHPGIVVDLDNEDMVDQAKQNILEDIDNMVKYNEGDHWITAEEEPGLTIDDIPENLWDDGDKYVIWSPSERCFWNDKDGWGSLSTADEYEGHERPTMNLPLPDGKWMNTREAWKRPANPDDDEFNCMDCKGCFDIEDSIESGGELYCPECFRDGVKNLLERGKDEENNS